MAKKVETQHESYKARALQWKRCRDCYEGSDAVKTAGTIYLPALDSHEQSFMLNPGTASTILLGSKYAAYAQRALFFNATRRTIDGFAGAVFQKAPTVKASADVRDQFKDVTLTGVPLEIFAFDAVREVLTVGRNGILVDMPAGGGPDARPYWAPYLAEDIVNWRTVRRPDGRRVTVLVVLREAVQKVDESDEFVEKTVYQYRVLELRGGAYVQTLWTSPDDGANWAPGTTVVPERRGKPLDFIPFLFSGAFGVTPDVDCPPMLDLVDLNLSHYRTSADLEHGRHFTALPQPWLSGSAARQGDEDIMIGSGGAWVLDKGGEAGMLEFTGQGLKALETADETKRKMMATMGARLLEEQSAQAETATAVLMRHSGEQATLRSIVQVQEQALTKAARIHQWWVDSKAKAPDDVDALVELNKDFFAVRMGSEDLKSLVFALQAGTMSFKTFYYNIGLGELVRPGVTAEEEQKEIEKENAAKAPMPGAALPPGAQAIGQKLPPGAVGTTNVAGKAAEGKVGVKGEVVKQGGPYRVEDRGGDFVVVKDATGEVVPGGNHGSDRKKALAHLAALEIAAKGEGK